MPRERRLCPFCGWILNSEEHGHHRGYPSSSLEAGQLPHEFAAAAHVHWTCEACWPINHHETVEPAE